MPFINFGLDLPSDYHTARYDPTKITKQCPNSLKYSHKSHVNHTVHERKSTRNPCALLNYDGNVPSLVLGHIRLRIVIRTLLEARGTVRQTPLGRRNDPYLML